MDIFMGYNLIIYIYANEMEIDNDQHLDYRLS